MFWTIGFQMTTAKSITAMEGFPTLVSTQSCFNPNDKLFGVIVGMTVGLLFTVPFHFFVLPKLLRSKQKFYLSFNMFQRSSEVTSLQMEKISTTNSLKDIEGQEEEEVEEEEQVKNVFQPLQVIAACFAALNHGGNDVGNCIGPLVTVFAMYKVSMQEKPIISPFLIYSLVGTSELERFH